MTDKSQVTEKQPGVVVDGTLLDNFFRRIRLGATFHTAVLYSLVLIQLFVFIFCWLICFEPLKGYAVLNQNALMSVYLLNLFSLFSLSLFGDLRRGFSWARYIFVICAMFEILFH